MLVLFGDKLRWLRTQRGMTQSELAQQLDLATQSHISHLEALRSAPSLDLVVRAADLFGVTTDYLLRDAIPVDYPTFVEARSQTGHTIAQQFGEKLRGLRKQHAMTQVELAEHLGQLSQAAISAFELGDKTPSIPIVLKCAELFGVRTDALLSDSAD